MVAIFDQFDHHIGLGQTAGKSKRGFIGYVRILHAVEQVDGAANPDGPAQQQMVPALLDQLPGKGDRVFFIGRGVEEFASLQELPALLGAETVPDQVLGEVRRRRDADQGRDPLGPGESHQQGNPAAHTGAHQNLRPHRQSIQHGQRIGKPPADGPLAEIARGGAMAEVVEAQEGLAPGATMGRQGAGLGPRHVRAKAAEEYGAWGNLNGILHIGDC